MRKRRTAVLRSAAGFSLVEMMIALAVSGAVFFAVQTFWVNQAQQTAKLMDNDEFADLRLSLTRSFMNPNFCDCNFRNLHFSGSAVSSLVIPFSELRDYGDDCQQGSAPIVRAGTPFHSIRGARSPFVTKISLMRGAELDYGAYKFDLQVMIDNGKGAEKPVNIKSIFFYTDPFRSTGDEKRVQGCSPVTFEPGATYRLECVAQNGYRQTISTVAEDTHVLVGGDPSGRGFWLVRLQNGGIGEQLDCLSDQAYTDVAGLSGPPPSTGTLDCQSFAPTPPALQPFLEMRPPHDKFSKGASQPISACRVSASF